MQREELSGGEVLQQQKIKSLLWPRLQANSVQPVANMLAKSGFRMTLGLAGRGGAVGRGAVTVLE